MTLEALIIENISDIDEEINNQFEEFKEALLEKSEDIKLKRLLGKDDDVDNDTSNLQLFNPSIDIEKFSKKRELVFGLYSIDYCWIMDKLFENQKLIKISIAGKEFMCIFEEDKYELIKQYLNQELN